MRVSERVFAVGFYDYQGVFFYMAERGRGTRSDFDLAGSAVAHVIRYETVGGYDEMVIPADMAEKIANEIA